MNASEIARALAAARSTGEALGLTVDDVVLLHNSNRLAVRLVPCDVVARVASRSDPAVDARELELARRLAEVGAPVGELDARAPARVHERDGFAITLWTYYEPLPGEASPREYAHALADLHAGMRRIEVSVPHFTDRVAEAHQLVADRALTPELADTDRRLLDRILRGVPDSIRSRGAPEQVLHGEPHPGNALRTDRGMRFIDLETCCRGPVEFDVAHAPEAVGEHYPAADRELLRVCRILTLALATTWRWERDDELPNGRQLAFEWLDQIRADLDRLGPDGRR